MLRLTTAPIRRSHDKYFIIRFRHSRSMLQTIATPQNHPQINFKSQVTIVGTNHIAQGLALLLRDHPLVSRLVLYDHPKSAYGIGLDLSHIPSQSIVEGRSGDLKPALFNADIVCLACGEFRQPGQTDYDLFRTNTGHLIHPVQKISRYCPQAFVINLTEPINYTVPLISRVLETENAYNKDKILGVTGTNTMRAQARLHELYEMPDEFNDIHVPVICGHSATTSVPLLSHVRPWTNIDNKAAANIIEYVRESVHAVSQRGSQPSSSLIAYAGFQMVTAVLNALNDTPDAQIAFVANDNYRTKFFASPVKITKDGISDIVDFKIVSHIEQAYLYESIQELANEIDEAELYYNEICHTVT